MIHLSETQISMLIGALIALFPTVLSGLFGLVRLILEWRHDRQLRQIELIDRARLEAIRDYAQYFGPFLALDNVRSFTPDKFVSAHRLAQLYVHPQTLAAMDKAFPIILASYDSYATLPVSDKISRPEIQDLIRCLRVELQSAASLKGRLPTPKK